MAGHAATAEDGYALWLRYAPLTGSAKERLDQFNPVVVQTGEADPSVKVAEEELRRGLTGLLGHVPASSGGSPIVLACNDGSSGARGHFNVAAHQQANGRSLLAISAADSVGCLYGAFALLRELSLGRDPATVELAQAPAMPLRMLDHWDNPDGTVERGYAGRSIFDWWHLPEELSPRMIDYARANASIGINGVVVNNVNASPLFLTERYLPKLKRLADAWRPYGIRLYISVRFSAPIEVGGLKTADPLAPQVKAWWKAQAGKLYQAIPDFGGFLVKANSEGQPGPQDYHRTHAQGANMLAAALGNRGTVIWRAFVYASSGETDRVKQAYEEFKPLDGKFAPNVILQVKNGPLDFQPREPFHPLFGAMPHTRMMLEAQITREYLGQATGIVYLAPLWKEVLDAPTGHGATVAQVIEPTGMAGVANTGSDRDWTGDQFDQANWYAFGRLAWSPALSSDQIAREWVGQTFSRNPNFVRQLVPMMLSSRQAVVDYMTPLGLAHQMGTGHHYGPAPWVCTLDRPEWNPCYYNRADAEGIGFDRTRSGSDALAQYAPSVAAQWADPRTMDENDLLWFHHLPWSYRTQSGKSLWDELISRYDRGVAAVDSMAREWQTLQPYVDHERFVDVASSLAIQRKEARWWRDASIAYWQSLNHLPLPAGERPPEHSLSYYEALEFPDAPG
ncbi:alpha-glucuronidase family glycosyl hydrolase [Qipengyuania algicida]|nr:alpha-glucuronidase family glycosyl hydrolase [Qipengyuania algicida]